MKICAAEKYSLLFILNILYSLVNHTILPSENPLRFRKNLLTWIYNKNMKFDDETKNEKLRYDINREAAKMSAWSSNQVGKYEYLTVKKYFLLIKGN